MQYRPAPADIPDKKGWRIRNADYGSLSRFARGKIDLEKIQRHWSDILRVVVSIYTGEIRAYDVMRMIQRDGNPTRSGNRSPTTGLSSKPSTSSPRPWRSPIGATSRACATCKNPAMHWFSVIGAYSFAQPDLGPAGVRQLRKPR
ncbi:Tn3 family transposase [Nonomuraea sp. NPDC049695]|uniref:Tn3 family transposase n=1 Tax=Nonomuraea sp. NPDC049695 TaxID=3154734 RepID=UPI00341B997A